MKYLALLAAMSATTLLGQETDTVLVSQSGLGVTDQHTCEWNHYSSLGVTTMGAHQSVGSVTGAIMCCCSNNFSLAANLS